MTVAQIQAFLDQQVPQCRAGHQPTCLRHYQENGKSAAQIIWETAQEFRINPQVLIVKIQKEQGLITNTAPAEWMYRTATGYGCPDTAPCAEQYWGFTNQVRWTGRMFRAIMNDSPTWWTPYNLGWNFIHYSPDLAGCGGSMVYIENRATKALYNYTPYQPNTATLAAGLGTAPCGAYGNRNFYIFFNRWFGAAQPTLGSCDAKVENIVCVWSVKKSDGSQFLTSSKAELENTISIHRWTYEGLAFYASKVQKTGTVPVYRLRRDNKHFYSIDQAEYTTMINSGDWVDESISFYVFPTTVSNSMSHPVYRLYNQSSNRHFWTKDNNQKLSLLNSGYRLETNAFNTLSGLIDLPIVTADRHNIYRLRLNSSYFYTTDLTELETAIRTGHVYEGVLATANADSSGTAIYRLRHGNGYFYTASLPEHDNAVRSFGMVSEGIRFYIDSSSARVYRLANIQSGRHLYTSSTNEAMSLINNGWRYENMLVNNNTNPSPVYRFLNLRNNRHFYTINVDEAASITNRNWKYETIAFYASRSSGHPVYRLRLNDKHFYTANVHERDIAINRHRYTLEGIAFYVSPTATDKPVYRLQGGSDQYFYTTSSSERDNAVNRFGFRYEGVGFYLP
jgi:hypothetical protein